MLARLGAEHGFLVEELHPPFDTEALTRSGHHLPVATREATASADAVLVAGDAAPALDGLRAALDLCATVTRVLDETGEATIFAPLDADAADWTVARAFTAARARSGRLASVGVGVDWSGLVDRHAERHPGVEVATVTAHSSAGKHLSEVAPHVDLGHDPVLQETSVETLRGHDVVVLALPHGQSGQIAAALRAEDPDVLVLDLGPT